MNNPPVESLEVLLKKKDELETLLDSFEIWVIVFGIFVVVGVGGEVVFGARAWWANRSLHVVQQSIDQIRQTEIAELNNKAALLQKEAAEAQLRGRPRILLDHKAFVQELKSKPKLKAEILFKQDDQEANSLAEQIRRWLGPGINGDGVGWDVSDPRPLMEEDALNVQGHAPNTPLATRAGAWFGVGLVVSRLPPASSPPFDSAVYQLSFALAKGGVSASTFHGDPRLPSNVIRIVIGQKLEH